MNLFFNIDTTDIKINNGELAERLRVDRNFDLESLNHVIAEVENAVDCRMIALRTPVTISGACIDLGFIKAESINLSCALQGANEAFVFCVTLGMGVDRLIMKYLKMGNSKSFFFDAVASAYAEAAADKAQEMLNRYAKTKKRFSPGYGDLPLEIQPDILSALNAEKLLGVTLTQGLLMKPTKTITAIVGIKNE